MYHQCFKIHYRLKIKETFLQGSGKGILYWCWSRMLRIVQDGTSSIAGRQQSALILFSVSLSYNFPDYIMQLDLHHQKLKDELN